jgi:hypothetical protein
MHGGCFQAAPLTEADELKNKGNEFFKAKKFPQSIEWVSGLPCGRLGLSWLLSSLTFACDLDE